MILTEVHFFSEVLTLRCTMYVILPQRTLADEAEQARTEISHAVSPAWSLG